MARMRRLLASVLLVVSASASLAACGDETVDMRNAEDEIAEGYARQVPTADVAEITCPDDVSAEIGTRTSCDMRLENGVELDIGVEVTGDEGRIRWRVDGGTVPGTEVERRAAELLTEEVGQAPDAIECPSRIAIGTGKVTRCTLVAGSDRLGVTITMTSDDGDFDVKVDSAPQQRP